MKVTGLESIQPLSRRSLASEMAKEKPSSGGKSKLPQSEVKAEVGSQGDIRADEQQMIIDAIERANRSLEVTNTRFEFSIHEETEEIMVKVIDEATDEIIREIPPEKILDIVAKMWELVGLFIDEKI